MIPVEKAVNNLVETGVPSEDLAAFRRCLGQFATGVTVVTTKVGDELYGVTSNSFSSVSLDPPLILWSLKRTSQSFESFKAAPHFAVNILASDQVALSQKFAKSGPGKFQGVSHREGHRGVPLLDDVVAVLECRSAGTFDGGDHLIIHGHVERYHRGDRPSLLFAQGRYGVAIDHPSSLPLQEAGTTMIDPSGELLTSLATRACSILVVAIENARKAYGLSVLQARFLKVVQTYPNRTLDSLRPVLLFGSSSADTTLAEVVTMGFVVRDELGALRLTAAGSKHFDAFVRYAKIVEDQVLGDVDVGALDITRQTLISIIEKNERGAQEG